MDSVAMLGRLIVSLAFVLGIVWFLARRVGKRSHGRDAGLIDVISRRQLSRNSSIAVIRVGEQALVVGVSDAQLSVLGETDLETALASASPKAGAKIGSRSGGRSGAKSVRDGLRRAAVAGRTSAPAPGTAALPLTDPTPRTATAPLTDLTPAVTAGRTDASVTSAIKPAVATTAAPRHASPLATDGAAQLTEPLPRSPLAGSALSPQTWKQTLESLREMTAR